MSIKTFTFSKGLLASGMAIEWIFQFLMAAFFGLAIGSFATMVYWRLPEHEVVSGKWLKGKRAYCTHCNVKLRTRDLLPVFNWLITKGKCFKCATPINPIYFFIEFFCGFFSVFAMLTYGFGDMYVMVFSLSVCVVIIAATAYSYQKIPSALLIALFFICLLYRVYLEKNLIDILGEFVIAVVAVLAVRRIFNLKNPKQAPKEEYFAALALVSLALPVVQYAAYFMTIGLFYMFLHLCFLRKKPTLIFIASALFLFAVFYPSYATVFIQAIDLSGRAWL